jgi:lipopolysaccharide/colanic/teichoic acid biosynthesis glycosyltransferase
VSWAIDQEIGREAGRFPPFMEAVATTKRTRDDTYHHAKRVVDVITSLVLLLLGLPLLVVIAAAIKATSRGPVLFRQVRVGTRRHVVSTTEIWETVPFVILKFRTMAVWSDETVHMQHIERFTRGTLEGEDTFKLADDPRVTRVGRVLRKASLDELPQLVNVLKGEMSLVGPRPVPIYEIAGYREDHHRRFAARPGMTGLWQVSGRAALSFEDMIRLDVEMVERRSLAFDLWLLARTAPAVLSRRGAS